VPQYANPANPANNNPATAMIATTSSSASNPATSVVPAPAPVAHVPAATSQTQDTAASVIADAMRLAKLRPGWAEQALDIFFRDFGDEDMDLQIKIAEKALSDENKAMVFVKMPVELRRHWIHRLREVHNRLGT
jgi:hypothetical protein